MVQITDEDLYLNERQKETFYMNYENHISVNRVETALKRFGYSIISINSNIIIMYPIKIEAYYLLCSIRDGIDYEVGFLNDRNQFDRILLTLYRT
jgi:hypothetical protein